MKCKNIKICFSGETEQGFVSPEKQKIHTYGNENLDVTYVKNLPGPGFTNRKGTLQSTIDYHSRYLHSVRHFRGTPCFECSF